MRILIAEDDHASRLILRKAVEKIGHECVVAEDGQQALDLFHQVRPNVIISGWTMRGQTGLELCQSVRGAEDLHFTYFVLLTAFDDKARIAAALEAGADDYLLKPLDRDELEARLVAAARVIGLHEQLTDAKRQLEQHTERVAEDHRRDPLTKIGNRHRMQEDLEALAARSVRYGHQFCLALCDLDHFKSYNDTCGLLAGDETLKAIARTLTRYSRSGDMAYRYAGQQFLVVLPEQSLDGGIIAMERRRRAVERLAIPHPAQTHPGCVTISAGLVSFDPKEPNALEMALRRVDRSLRHAKENGRNRVSTYLQVEEFERASLLPRERPSQP